jgi:LuxR family transcriptional regulator, maltose regulon positive regulatory protein
MAKMTPIVRGDTLVYQQDEREQVLVVETPAWYAWLATATTFAFTSDSGTFTARKERAGNKRGGLYWKAYRTQHNKLSSLYLGKAEALTLERLNAVAQALAHASSEDATGEVDVERASPPTEEVKRPVAIRTHSDPLLATKLHVPRQHTPLVHRSHLVERLQQAVERPLTLIAAPAGFGKTTLLSTWLAQAPVSAAWVSLDSGDDEPTRFWSYTLAALDSVFPGCGTNALALLQSPQPPAMETVLTGVINALTTMPQEVALIWDDYHLVTTHAIHTAVTYLLDHLPSHLHLIIATRADPPLPLARLRTRAQLVELRSADLRFTSQEVVAFLVQVHGLALAPEDITALEARTEGWIAGLQLAALSLQGRQDVAGFIQAFTGSHRSIVDYLVQEVLVRQSKPIQTFLLRTSILERLHGSLCESVTGEPNGQAMLERLEQAHLFLNPLDDERQWYRYHQLFADVLRRRLTLSMQQEQPGEAQTPSVAELHQRAAAWFEQHGYLTEAINHLKMVGDIERVARLIEENGASLIQHGELSTLLRWIDALPEDLVCSRLHLCLIYAEALAYSGLVEAAEVRLQDVEHIIRTMTRPGVNDPPGDALRGEVLAMRAMIAAYLGMLERTLTLSHQAVELLPQDSNLLCVIEMSLGIAHKRVGNDEEAHEAFSRARELSRMNNKHVEMISVANLALILHKRGRLHQAMQVYQQALQLAHSGPTAPAVCMAYLGIGALLREWNDLDDATTYLQTGFELAQLWGFAGMVVEIANVLARVKQIQGDTNGALQLLDEAERLSLHHQEFSAMVHLHVYQARLQLQLGNIEYALQWEREYDRNAAWRNDAAIVLEYFLVQARVSMAKGSLDEAEAVLDRLLAQEETHERVGNVIKILVLQAVAYQERMNTTLAVATLARALSLAEPEGYIRIFVDEGAVMARLLVHVHRLRRKGKDTLQQKVSLTYIEKLLALIEAGDTKKHALATQQAQVPALSLLAEPLSERELDVLRLIAAGHSNREIAAQLVVAISTVKSHINAIYGKLDVKSRTQAIARARALNLL